MYLEMCVFLQVGHYAHTQLLLNQPFLQLCHRLTKFPRGLLSPLGILPLVFF